ncbi:MAG: PstC family ABC transporter permease [Candidatus Brocadiaceae bacterium]
MNEERNGQSRSLLLSRRASRLRRFGSLVGHSLLFLVTAASTVAVFFIFWFIIKDALPFFRLRGVTEFLTSTEWYPSREPASFGALPLFYGSAMVTGGAVAVAVPLGVLAAVCLSDVLPFWVRQLVKPVIEILAAIPSVAYGFFALVVFAPLLQEHGGVVLATGTWVVGLPLAVLVLLLVGDAVSRRLPPQRQLSGQLITSGSLAVLAAFGLYRLSAWLLHAEVISGANALNVSVMLGIMALPTVVSVSEDALQAAGRELREASYALGATRVETIFRVIIPASAGGICAAVILGVMRAVGETMVVWMASGNAAQIPHPFYNFLQPVRTMTATIAGDMGEADQVTGSARYHVLFALALCLLAFCFVANLVTEWVTRRAKAKLE